MIRVLVQHAIVRSIVARPSVVVSVDPLEDVDMAIPPARHPSVACALGIALVGSPVSVRNIISAEALCISKATGQGNDKHVGDTTVVGSLSVLR